MTYCSIVAIVRGSTTIIIKVGTGCCCQCYGDPCQDCYYCINYYYYFGKSSAGSCRSK